MNFISTYDINTGLEKSKEAYIKKSEEIYLSSIEAAAEKIFLERKDKPVILISGPSGSGKTTTAIKLAGFIERRGVGVHTLSMDNYFLPSDMGELPKDENGNIDLESPKRLDCELLSEHLNKIFSCESVNVPIFDFTEQLRKGSVPLQRKRGEIVIIEGIHALNPSVTGDTKDFTTCVYVSVRTRIKSCDGSILHPKYLRLMRRLSRDRLFRGRNPADVFDMFESVSRGEDLYIMPYKSRALISIDTFIPFESAVYSRILSSELSGIKVKEKWKDDYLIIRKFLNEIHPLDLKYIPSNSFIREFAGGSSIKY